MLTTHIRNLNISRKLNLLVIAAVLGCLAIELFSLYGLKKELLNDRKAQLQTLVDSTHSLVNFYALQEKEGKLSLSEAQTQAMQAISAIRYDKTNYFWVNDYNATMIFHPIKPQLNGKDLSNSKDPSGKRLFIEMVEVVKQDQAGFVAYMWSKPGSGSNTPVDKLSYVKGYADWQWIIGTGIYIDDIDSVFWTEAIKLIGLALLVLLGLVYTAWNLISVIVTPLKSIQKLVQQVESTGDYSLRSTITQHDEIGQMAGSLNSMLSNQQTAVREINKVVSGLASGDTSHRVAADLVGDLLHLKNGVNNSIDQISVVLNELSTVMSGLAHGDFKRKVDLNTQGIFLEIARSTNDATAAVSKSMSIVKSTMQSMVQGDFNCKIDQTMEGDFHDLKQHVNLSLEVIAQAIREISHVAERMAKEDLSQRISGQYQGQLEELSTAVNSSLNQLVNTIDNVQTASAEMASATTELSSASQQLSQRTQTQAARLDQTSASMVGLNTSVQENADSVSHANKLVVSIQDELNHSVSIMDNTVDAMDKMQESSKKVSTIVELIDEIAFQTNLLALNAAVEAARAGEHGRGFAVVAHEVQVLAKRSAEASKEIKQLIDNTLISINDSIAFVHQSNEGITEVVDSVENMSALIGNISQASAKQTQEINKVNTSINHLDRDTQQNAALAEETSAVASNIEKEAAGLGTVAKRFTI